MERSHTMGLEASHRATVAGCVRAPSIRGFYAAVNLGRGLRGNDVDGQTGRRKV